MKETVMYGRRMNGYEFIEFMKQFNWKDSKGRYIGDFQRPKSIGQSIIDKKRFEGWKYWFDRTCPMDVLDEEILITYSYTYTRTYYISRIDEFLRENGFELLEGVLWDI